MGILLGVLAGSLPGLGTGSTLGILFVILLKASPESIIIFYLGILISAQYFGSVTAILTGVPGDTSAIPSAKFGFQLAKKGYGPALIFATAKYSLWSGFFSFLLLLAILHYGWYWANALSTIVQSIIFLLAVVLLVVLSRENKIAVNCLLSVFGFLIGAIGYSVNYQTYFLVSYGSMLNLGVPWVPVMIGLMVIPALISIPRFNVSTFTHDKTISICDNLTWVATRGGVIGFLLGNVPGLSYILSSLVSAKVEESRSNNYAKIVVASESANNAGAVGMLLPLFLLGIPITVSEVIVFSLLTSHVSLSSIPELILDNWIIISVYFFIMNLILFFLSWKLALPICRFLFSNGKVLILVSLIFSLAGTVWLGWYNQQIYLYLIILAISSLIGIFVKVDWTVTIFSMLLYSQIETNFYKLSQLYF